MTFGHTDNKTSRELNKAGLKAQLRGPTLKQTAMWHQEFLDSGAQFRMSFLSFKNGKLKNWYKQQDIKRKKKYIKRSNRVKASPQ
jgi:hypothetical protein